MPRQLQRMKLEPNFPLFSAHWVARYLILLRVTERDHALADTQVKRFC